MTVDYRFACATDVQAVSEIYWQALLKGYQEHGFQDHRKDCPVNPFYDFALRTEPEGFFVAQDSGRVVGAAISWVRGSSWFLSHLFVLPEYQGKGTGKTLLDNALGYAHKKGAGTAAVMTMAFNPASVALYMKHGMFPVQDIYLMHLRSRTTGRRGIQTPAQHPDSPAISERQLHEVNHIDSSVLGMDREMHHRYFLEDEKCRGWLIRYRQKPVAYAYQWPDGRIGPVAALEGTPYRDILKAVIRPAMQEGSELSLMVPGANRVALEVAFSLGFEITMPYLLLSSRPFGAWERYLFHSPGLM